MFHDLNSCISSFLNIKYASVFERMDGKLRWRTCADFWNHRDDVKRFTCPPVRISRTPITEFRDIRAAKPRQRVQRVLWAAITSGSAVSLLTRLCARLRDLIYRLRRICERTIISLRLCVALSEFQTSYRMSSILYIFPVASLPK